MAATAASLMAVTGEENNSPTAMNKINSSSAPVVKTILLQVTENMIAIIKVGLGNRETNR